MSVRVNIYYGDTVYNLLASNTDTLSNLLSRTDIPKDTVVFSAPPFDANMTPLVNLEKTLVDYNMWFLEKSYVAELSAYNKTDNYKKELYEMYLEAAKETV
jgi:hypothetical protein